MVLTAVRWTDRNLVAAVRRRPVRSAAHLAGIPQLRLLLFIFACLFFVLRDEPLWPRYSRGHGTMEP
jgi:hypothetical protein